MYEGHTISKDTLFFSRCGNTDTLKATSMCLVDFQLLMKEVVRQSRYVFHQEWTQYKNGFHKDFTLQLIKFLIAENKSGAKIHSRRCAVYSEEHVMNAQNVPWWYKMFKERKTSTHDKEWEDQPCSEIDETMWCVRILLDKYCLTVTDL